MLGERNRLHFDKFLTRKNAEVCESLFLEKFELDEDGDKAFPLVSNSLKDAISKNFLGLCPQNPFFLFPQNFQIIFHLHFTFASVNACN